MAALQEIQVPLLAVNDTSLTIVEMNVSNGGKVSKGDVVMVFETSKTTYEVEAETDGYVQYLCRLNEDYEVNTVVAKIYATMEEAGSSSSDRPVKVAAGITSPIQPLSPGAVSFSQPVTTVPFGGGEEPAMLSDWKGQTLFSEAADRLIQSAGLDRSVFAGRDLVTAQDVRQVLEPAAKKTAVKTSPQTTLPVDPQKVVVERLSSGKKREIEYLSDVQTAGLTSTINTYVDTEGIFTYINRSLKYLKDSLLPVILYESSRLLADYPLLNGYFTGDSIALYREINPGFAIDIDKGLKVLKIAAADQRSIPAIEEEILRLSEKYLDETLDITDLTDITFTITDLSAEAVAFFRPLINKMNSSILGVSAIDEKLQRLVLSLTFDHRVTEGKQAAQFLKELKERLESYRVTTGPKEIIRNASCFKCYKKLSEDLSGTGFARCITPEGKDGYVCQSCLKGF